VLLLVAIPLAVFYRGPLQEAWVRAGHSEESRPRDTSG
jgi:hypothetical protein